MSELIRLMTEPLPPKATELKSKCCGAKVKLKASSIYRGFKWASYCSKCNEPCKVEGKEESASKDWDNARDKY